MKKLFCRFLGGLFIFASLFTSCSTTNKAGRKISPVYITNTKKFYLLSPDYIEKDLDCQQQLVGYFGDNEFTFLAYLQGDENGIFLSLYNDFGTSMGTLSYDGYSVSFDSPIFPKELKAEYIAADLQFAYYKTDDIRNLLKEIKLDFIIENDGEKEIRRIFDGNDEIEEIVKEGRVVSITNKLRGYRYILTQAED